MSQKIPFLKIFSAFPDKAGEVAQWQVTGAVVDKRTRTIKAQVLCPVLPDEAFRTRVEADMAAA